MKKIKLFEEFINGKSNITESDLQNIKPGYSVYYLGPDKKKYQVKVLNITDANGHEAPVTMDSMVGIQWEYPKGTPRKDSVPIETISIN